MEVEYIDIVGYCAVPQSSWFYSMARKGEDSDSGF